jgi:hypothetical protein
VSGASRPFRPRLVRGESRREGRHFEAVRAALRRAGLASIAGGAKPAGIRVPVAVRARFTAEGIRTLYAAAHAFRREGAGPGALDGPLSRALHRVARRPLFDADALERWILTEGQVLGAAVLDLELDGPALRAAVELDGEPLATGADLRLELAGSKPLTAPLEAGGAVFGAAGVALRKRALTRVALVFGAQGELRLEPLTTP